MACKHEHVEITLEMDGRPVWLVWPDEARRHEGKSEETWMGGVTYRCLDCGKHDRYTGSQVPKWLMARIDALPIWDKTKRPIGRSTLSA